MKALNKKDRQNAIFKFSLIYGLSILFLGFLFWQVRYVPEKVEDTGGSGGGKSITTKEMAKIEEQSEFLKVELDRAKEYIQSMMGSFGYADEKLEFYYRALEQQGESAMLDKDVRNNQKIAAGLIDSLEQVIRRDYEVKEYKLLEKNETMMVSIKRSLSNLDGIMKGVVSEFEDRNSKNQYLTLYANKYFSCLSQMDNLGQANDVEKRMQECEFKSGMFEKELIGKDQKLFEVERQLEAYKDKAASGSASSQELQDYKDAFSDCDIKRLALKTEIEKAERELSIIAGRLRGKGDKSEEKDLNNLAKHLLEVRQQQ